MTGDDRAATGELMQLVYEQLCILAHRRIAHESPGLASTDLVHETYLRLMNDPARHWDGCGHFFAAAAEAMRRILIERARKCGRPKHGGGRHRVSLTETSLQTGRNPEDLRALHEALTGLQNQDRRTYDIIMLRFSAGLNVRQIAETLDVSASTVVRDWRCARRWLREQLSGASPVVR
jgi:RNA polymerase sigma factor (TIGR02999 family)